MVMKEVKYHPKMKIIVELIHLLYDLPDCEAGGCCHIVTDDDNIDDDDLQRVIDYCNMSDNNRLDKELSRTICEILLQLTREQRICLFYFMNAGLLEDGIDEWDWDFYFEHFNSPDNILAAWDNFPPHGTE